MVLLDLEGDVFESELLGQKAQANSDVRGAKVSATPDRCGEEGKYLEKK